MRLAPSLERRVGAVLSRVAAGWAVCGGLVLIAIAGVTVVSVIGRALSDWGLGPVTGDFELVEMGCAVAVFAFLPWCQVRRGHVTVDVLADRLPPRARFAVSALGEILMALVAVTLCWRLWLGFVEKFPYGGPALREALGMGAPPFFVETTYDLQMPVWIPFGLCLIGAGLFALCCLHTVWARVNGDRAPPDLPPAA